jgi:CRP/FNR family cyclic AMP-dependent transcriptional regulator
MVIVETVVFLQHVPLFAGLTVNELIEVASIAKEVPYPAGSKIISEGDHGDYAFVVVDGEVLVHRGDLQIQKLGPKEVFGEMSVLDGQPRSASVTSISRTLILRIDQRDFLNLLTAHTSIAVSMVRTLSHRLRTRL